MSQAGYTPIQLYYSTTAAAVPVNTNLADGELAINITDGKLYYKNAGGTVTLLASTAGAAGDVVGPASSTDNALARFDLATGKLIQNSVGILSDAGILTGLTGLTSSGSITLSSLTSGRVPYASTGGLLVDSANLTFNGTTLTVNDITDSSLTAGRVTFAGTAGNLTDSANLVWDNTNGRLGIGNSSPPVKLVVGAATGAQNTARIYGDNTTSNAPVLSLYRTASRESAIAQTNTGMVFANTGGLANYLDATIDAAANLIILNGGNVGIGTSTPNFKLETQTAITVGVTGTNLANNTAVNSAFIYTDPGSVAGGDGKAIAIGMNARARVYISATHPGTSKDSSDLALWTTTGAVPNERLRVTSLGDVGIGTSSPAAKFVVASGNTLLGHNTLDNYGGNVDIRSAYQVRAANTPTQLFVANSAGSQTIDTGGAIDLGGYTDSLSRAYTYARIQGLANAGTGYGGYLSLMTTNAGGAVTERFRIGTAGQLGIGGATYGTSGQVLTSGGSGAAPTWTTVSGGGSVAGSNGQVQFNNSGSFGADGGFYWDNTNKRLSINAGSSPTEALVVTGRIRMGTNYIVSDNVSPTFYISTTGSDSTGTGTTGNPWATLNKAMEAIPKFMPNGATNCTVVLKNGTYTLSSVQYIRGITGGGRITIQAETAGSVTVNQNGYQYEIERNNAQIWFNGITFQTASNPSMFNIYDTLQVNFESNCAFNQMISSGSSGNFNQAIGVSNSGFQLQGTFTVVNEASYGAVINIYGNSTYYFGGTFTKSGAKHGNAAISIQGASTGTFQNTINNFYYGINMGQSHYDAEQFGLALANNLSITNCTIGIRLSNNGSFKNYYIASFSGTTTPVYWVNGWYSGTASSEYNLIGYNTSVSSSYRLQVNSQIYATSSTIATSDGRYKKNVAVIANGLDIVKALRPVQFDWIPHDIHNFDTEHTTVGFIAQEVKEVLAGTAYVDSIIKPHYITREAEEYDTIIITPATEEVIDENGNLISLAAPPVTEKRITKPAVTEEFFGIAEGNLIAILTKAIQEQQVIIETLTARVDALEAR